MSDASGGFVGFVEARCAIEQLLARYAELIDDGDFDGVGALLAECVLMTDDGTRVAGGRDEIAALYRSTTRLYDDGTPRTSHVMTNLIVEPDLDPPGEHDIESAAGPRLVARSYFTVFQATDDVVLQAIIAGRYQDVVERRTDGTWVIVERRFRLRLLGDLRAHLLFDPATLGPPSAKVPPS